jgi:DNA-binding MarR family transcriptional regulator
MSLNRTELRTWFKMIGGIKSLLDALDRQLRAEAGMSHDDYQMLSRLHREPGRVMRMSDLAGEIGYSPSRLSHAVSRLELEGWVRRTPSHDDRRVIEARLTDTGATRVRQVSADHLALVRRLVFDTLGPDAASEIADAIDQIGRAASSEG